MNKEQNKDNFLLRIKKKLSDRHIYSVMVVILAVIIGVAIYFYKEKANYESYLQNTFQEAFYDSAKYIDDVDNLIAKINLTNKPSQRVKLFTDIYREAAEARNNMARLPYNQAIMTQLLKFLTQLSDFSYSMLIKSSQNQDMTDEEWKHIKALSNYSTMLAQKMDQIKQQVNDGNRINWNEIKNEGAQALQANVTGSENKSVTGSMSDIEKNFENYPTLIYDGPFSEHIEQMEPRFLKNKEWIRADKAQEVATNFFEKDKIEKIEMVFATNTKEKYVVPVYRFRVRLNNTEDYTAIIDITQQGGYPLWMLNYKDIQEAGKKLEINELANNVKQFLTDKGYPNMEVNYYEIMENSIVFNFAYEKDDITVYSDLLKVKVSLIDGEILGFESLGYIMMHTNRKFPEVKLTETMAKEEVSKDFVIEQVRLALIPMQSKKEVLCYELRGKLGEREYLVYINAQDGKHENILEVIKNKNGVFTQ